MYGMAIVWYGMVWYGTVCNGMAMVWWGQTTRGNKVSSLNTWTPSAAGVFKQSDNSLLATPLRNKANGVFILKTPFRNKANAVLITNGIEFIYMLAQQTLDNLEQI